MLSALVQLQYYIYRLTTSVLRQRASAGVRGSSAAGKSHTLIALNKERNGYKIHVMYIAGIDEIESEYQWLMDGDTVHVRA